MYTAIDKPTFWDNKYKTHESNWDMKSANPVFIELLDNSDFLKTGRTFIVSCDRGYDAVLTAKKDYAVTAIDFSSTAIDFAKAQVNENTVKINFLNEDFFNLGKEYNGNFDLVYEYTTYCAFNPERRKEFAKKESSLLKKDVKLITVLFPVDDMEDGPPFRIEPIEFYKNFSQYLFLELSTKQINSVKPREGKEILQVYVKK